MGWLNRRTGPDDTNMLVAIWNIVLPSFIQTYGPHLLDGYAALLRSEYGVTIDDAWAWEQYRREAFAGLVMAVVASQMVGGTERSKAMFAAMATRHLQHAIDVDSESLI